MKKLIFFSAIATAFYFSSCSPDGSNNGTPRSECELLFTNYHANQGWLYTKINNVVDTPAIYQGANYDLNSLFKFNHQGDLFYALVRTSALDASKFIYTYYNCEGLFIGGYDFDRYGNQTGTAYGPAFLQNYTKEIESYINQDQSITDVIDITLFELYWLY